MDVPAALDEDAFRAFFERHHAELARFAWMLVGERTAAEDIAADAMLAVWRQWDQARRARSQIAYARGIVANLAKTRIRAAVRERRRNTLFWQKPTEAAEGPDTAAVVDVRAALDRLPMRRRACVVLRHSLGLSERETADALGISVGTVKSQTSKGLADLRRLLGPSQDGPAWAPIRNGVVS
ncbi:MULTISPECIES: SigE family RNA polymerase sigma factor [Glycomyces]|uniref:RNA polymerase sigma-70 factor (Sigma-E family) n=1 Tax=Glycomyces artemisiae TaxID=1076443 RepID=A0A2T0URW6_9ACTN|nr:SigE family RNA polymerase sigma factor [Glycomyces artemisiae]PRY60608.1 RNA polymerase sigma-70 factor (sigma-E family) [Glycomyces artemisiae]